MDHDQEYWDVEVQDKEKKDLEPEIFKELNQDYNAEEKDDITVPQKYNIKILIAIITLLVFSVFIAGNFFRLLNIPDLSFLAKTSQLEQETEIGNLQEAVVIIENQGKTGTGFNVSPEGLIITNEHVIRDSRNLFIKFPSEESFKGTPVLILPDLDLAVLSIQGENLPTLKLGSADYLKIGEKVLIIGNPLGVSGIAKGGEILGRGFVEGIEEEVILINGPIHQGSSGSPVFNQEEEVVAVIFAVLVSKELEKDEIIGLALPIDLIKGKIKK